MNEIVTCNWCQKPKKGLETGLCEHCHRFGISDRQKALTWWNGLSRYSHESCDSKESLCNKYHPERFFNTLTGREIEEIWKKEKTFLSSGLTQEEFNKNCDKFFGGKVNS